MSSQMQSAAVPTRDAPLAGLTLASRGDALTPHLFAALRRRYPVVAEIDPELTRSQRYLVAATTVRPTRSRWAERFYKSSRAVRLRSENAARRLGEIDGPPGVVFQVHALFSVASPGTVIYVDATHQQAVDHWPSWNPLRGRDLDNWLRQERAVYQEAAHLFVFSEPVLRSLVDDYDVDPSRVTVTGAGANLMPPAEAVARRAPTDPPTILFIGNDFVRKGGQVLVDAFAAVRSVIPEARLQLVGTTPPVQPQPGVEVLGRIHDRAVIAELFAGASVFAMPSLYDPFPLAVLEAMAYGLPTVTTRQFGVPEMVVDGETSYLIEPGRVDELADALLRVLQDPATAARVGVAARGDVERRFTWDAVVGRMSPVLDRLLAQGVG